MKCETCTYFKDGECSHPTLKPFTPPNPSSWYCSLHQSKGDGITTKLLQAFGAIEVREGNQTYYQFSGKVRYPKNEFSPMTNIQQLVTLHSLATLRGARIDTFPGGLDSEGEVLYGFSDLTSGESTMGKASVYSEKLAELLLKFFERSNQNLPSV